MASLVIEIFEIYSFGECMTQSFKCQKCGAQILAKEHKHHEITGDMYYVCDSCESKNKVVQLPTQVGAPVQFTPSGLID